MEPLGRTTYVERIEFEDAPCNTFYQDLDLNEPAVRCACGHLAHGLCAKCGKPLCNSHLRSWSLTPFCEAHQHEAQLAGEEDDLRRRAAEAEAQRRQAFRKPSLPAGSRAETSPASPSHNGSSSASEVRSMSASEVFATLGHGRLHPNRRPSAYEVETAEAINYLKDAVNALESADVPTVGLGLRKQPQRRFFRSSDKAKWPVGPEVARGWYLGIAEVSDAHGSALAYPLVLTKERTGEIDLLWGLERPPNVSGSVHAVSRTRDPNMFVLDGGLDSAVPLHTPRDISKVEIAKLVRALVPS